MRVTVAPGAGKSWTLVVRKNGANTTVGCTISAAATQCSDTVNSVSYVAGDLISFRVTPAGGPPAGTYALWTAQYLS
jgi:hypothetical protein